jgi:hypothetical protein
MIQKRKFAVGWFNLNDRNRKQDLKNRFSPNLNSTNKKRPLIRAFFAFRFFKILL